MKGVLFHIRTLLGMVACFGIAKAGVILLSMWVYFLICADAFVKMFFVYRYCKKGM